MIEVRSIGIPGYLDQNGIVKTSSAYEFDTYANQLWAEPLAVMLQAVMVQNLAQMLPAATVLVSGGAIDAAPQILVEINVQKFDPDGAGSLVLLAQVAIKDGATHALLHAQTLRLTAQPGLGVTAMVAAMSQVWGQAAEQIAGMVGST